MTLTVVHVNNPDGFDVYVGRRVTRARNPAAHVESVFRNSYRVGGYVLEHREYGTIYDLTQLQAVELFDWWQANSDSRRVAMMLEALDGWTGDERLGCWCAPLRRVLTAADPAPAICHGQILARLWEERHR